jgi:hypothetical protein
MPSYEGLDLELRREFLNEILKFNYTFETSVKVRSVAEN